MPDFTDEFYEILVKIAARQLLDEQAAKKAKIKEEEPPEAESVAQGKPKKQLMGKDFARE